MGGYRLTQLGTLCFYYNALMGSSALKIPEVLSHGTGLGHFADTVLLTLIAILALVVVNQMIGNMNQTLHPFADWLLFQLERIPLLEHEGPEQPSQSSEIRITIYDFFGLRLGPRMRTLIFLLFLMSWSCIMVENSTSFVTQVASAAHEDSKIYANIISILYLLLIARVTQMLNLKMMENLQIAMAVCRILILILIGISWSVISNLEIENQDSDHLNLLQTKEESTSWKTLWSTVNVMFCGFFLHITVPSIVAVSSAEEHGAMNTTAIFIHYVICLILGCLYPSQYSFVQLDSLASSDPMVYCLVEFGLQLCPIIIAISEVNLYWWICRQLVVDGLCFNNGGICEEHCVDKMRWVFLLFPVLLYYFICVINIVPLESGILMFAAGLIYQFVVIGYADHDRGWRLLPICLVLVALAIVFVGIACFFFELRKL